MRKIILSVNFIFFLFIIQFLFLNNFVIGQNKSAPNYHNNIYSEPYTEILFIANVNGVIENCDCGNPPLGGLPQISSIISTHLNNNKYAYFFDGGDFLNTYPYPELNNAVISIYKNLDLTYLAAGDQEWIDSEEIDQKVFSAFEKKIIAGNFSIPDYDLTEFGTIALADGSTAYILSYLDENAFYVTKDKKNITFNDQKFVSAYNKVIQKNGLIILLYHGTENHLRWIIDNCPEIDLILFAHEQSNAFDTSKRPVVVGGGTDGEYVQWIGISKKENNIDFIVKSIPVSADLDGDNSVQDIINEFNISNEDQNSGY